jgi:hypothetical protein
MDLTIWLDAYTLFFSLLQDTLLSTMHFDKCIESEPCGVTSI